MKKTLPEIMAQEAPNTGRLMNTAAKNTAVRAAAEALKFTLKTGCGGGLLTALLVICVLIGLFIFFMPLFVIIAGIGLIYYFISSFLG